MQNFRDFLLSNVTQEWFISPHFLPRAPKFQSQSHAKAQMPTLRHSHCWGASFQTFAKSKFLGTRLKVPDLCSGTCPTAQEVQTLCALSVAEEWPPRPPKWRTQIYNTSRRKRQACTHTHAHASLTFVRGYLGHTFIFFRIICGLADLLPSPLALLPVMGWVNEKNAQNDQLY